MKKIIYKIGQIIPTRQGKAEIVRVYPFGTVDVKKIGTDRHFRITGLRLYA